MFLGYGSSSPVKKKALTTKGVEKKHQMCKGFLFEQYFVGVLRANVAFYLKDVFPLIEQTTALASSTNWAIS